jgi:chaperonin GroEL (HSP60 family)
VRTGWLTSSFITDQATGWAVLDDPAVLVCAAPVTSMRELLPVMERAAMSRRSLVIAAPSIAPDVLATLEVNVIQQKVQVLAVSGADASILGQLAERTGATIVERSDLQAGFLPSEHLGHIGRWVSDQRRSFLLGPRTGSA